MKLITRIPVIGLFCFVLTNIVWGQGLFTQFDPAEVNAPVGSTFSITLKVKGFTNIATFQLPVTFSKTLLELISVTDYAVLPGFAAGSHTALSIANGGATTTGRITFSWQADPQSNLSGSTLTDNTGLFTLTFKVKANGVTTVNVANVGAGVEVTRGPSLTYVPVYYQNGGSKMTLGAGATPSWPLTGFKIVANDICILPGQIECMPVTVNDFNGIQAVQFATHWNPTLLQFESVRNLNLPGWNPNDFVADNATGLLKSAWGTPIGLGITRPNGAALFSICFKSITADTTTDVIRIDGNGMIAEAINDAGMDLATAGFGIPDTVFINHCRPSISTATETLKASPVSFSVAPNPFAETTYATFELEKAAELRLQVSDLTGRAVYVLKNTFPAGPHRVELGHAQLNSPGAYFLSLQVEDRTTVRPIFLQ